MHLLILALQLVHRIARKLSVSIDLPSFFELYGSSPEVFNHAINKLSVLLGKLINEYGVSW